MARRSTFTLCVVLACGNGDASSGGSSDEGSTSSPEGSSTSSSGGSSSESGDDTTTSGGSTSGVDGSSSSETTGGPAIMCNGGEARVVGELEGRPIDLTPQLGGVAAMSIGIRLSFGELGRAYLRSDVEDVAPHDPIVGWGYLHMPSDGPAADEWFCFDDTSRYSSDGDSYYAATLSGLQPLGACPGTPVSGGASICFFGGDCGEPQFVSEVEGASFTVPLGGLGKGQSQLGRTDFELEYDIGLQDGGVVYLHATTSDPDAVGPQQSPVDAVYFIVPLGEEDGGAIYCAETGSTVDFVYDARFLDPISAEIVNVSRLGTCTGAREGDGHLDICLNLGS